MRGGKFGRDADFIHVTNPPETNTICWFFSSIDTKATSTVANDGIQ
jgi:hypothetical protein